jgi:hypothetical protein
MSDRLDSILYTLNSLHSVSITLTEFARELIVNPSATLTEVEEVPELLAEALATTLDCLGTDRLTEAQTQLVSALLRFVEGNVPQGEVSASTVARPASR